MNAFQQVRTGFNKFERVLTSSNRFQQVRTGFNKFERVSTNSYGSNTSDFNFMQNYLFNYREKIDRNWGKSISRVSLLPFEWDNFLSINTLPKLWTGFNNFERILTNSNRFQQFRTGFNKFEWIWTSSNRFQQVRTGFNKFVRF